MFTNDELRTLTDCLLASIDELTNVTTTALYHRCEITALNERMNALNALANKLCDAQNSVERLTYSKPLESVLAIQEFIESRIASGAYPGVAEKKALMPFNEWYELLMDLANEFEEGYADDDFFLEAVEEFATNKLMEIGS